MSTMFDTRGSMGWYGPTSQAADTKGRVARRRRRISHRHGVSFFILEQPLVLYAKTDEESTNGIEAYKVPSGSGILSTMMPRFPEFKPLELEDRDTVHQILWAYQAETSELTFTNLFIWRSHYGFSWSLAGDWLFLVASPPGGEPFAFPPVGPSPRGDRVDEILQWLKEAGRAEKPRIDRADQRLAGELSGDSRFVVEPVRAHFDYVYKTEDLIGLAGGAYRAKRNHINYFLRSYTSAYEELSPEHIQPCLDMTGCWCEVRRCEEDLNLMGEWDAIREALTNFRSLELKGGVILVNNRVEAFTLGERLNNDTAVVHIEKANAEIRGLYAMINQQFCEKQWKDMAYVNREQDLGEPGLREAKLSYNPTSLTEKYRITLA
jgi:uncharacterized protein